MLRREDATLSVRVAACEAGIQPAQVSTVNKWLESLGIIFPAVCGIDSADERIHLSAS